MQETNFDKNRMSRRSFLKVGAGALGAAGLLGLAACGGSSSSDSGSSDSSSSSDSASSADSSSEEYTLVEPGKLTMISNFYFPPFVSMKEGTGEFEGFAGAMYAAICDKRGLEQNILPSVQFDTIVPTIKQGGKADVSLGAISITPDREKEVDMSDPYLDSNQAICVRTDSTATTAEALNAEGMQIAVQSGTTGESWAEENLPNATIVPLDDIIQALTGVQTGLYNACVSDLPVISYEIKIAYSDLMIPDGGEIPTGEQYGVVISKDNPKLTEAINKALKEIKEDGTQDEIETKWFGEVIS